MTITSEQRGRAGIDAGRWPDIAAVPKSSVRARIARRLFRHAAAQIPVRVLEGSAGDSNWYGAGTSKDPIFHVVRPDAFYRRLGDSGTIGFGEAYMAGDWTSDDVPGVLEHFAARLQELIPAALHKMRRAVLAIQPGHHDNTIDGARDNIHAHYDLSNELFTIFLDETMTYSSAIFAGEPNRSPEPLEVAQRRKINRLLEIGTGWGELSLIAGARGAQVTSLTISAEQARLARDRIAAAGLTDHVTVLELDYREVRGRFDAVVSVEMIEAVGARHWATYFGTIDSVLVPGGRVGLQGITQDDRTTRETQDTYTWIRKYIFPGGQLPSVEAIDESLAAHTSLRVTDRYSFGQHYAETLRRWRTAFEARAVEVDNLGFDAIFRRMWSFYLAYCEAGFRSGYIDVWQFTMTKG